MEAIKTALTAVSDMVFEVAGDSVAFIMESEIVLVSVIAGLVFTGIGAAFMFIKRV